MGRSSNPKPVRHVAADGAVTWRYRVDAPTAPGEPRRQIHRTGFESERDALRSMRAELRRFDEGIVVVPKSDTVGEYLAGWLDALQRAESTLAQYRQVVEQHVSPRIGKVKLQGLTGQRIAVLYKDLQRNGGAKGTGVSAAVASQVHRVLHKAFADAVRADLILRNPCDLVDKPKAPPAGSTMRTWTNEEAVRFVTGATDDWLYPTWCLMLVVGLRRGEAAGIRWDDLDLKSSTLSLRRALVRKTDGRVYESTGKTLGSRRLVSLEPNLVAILTAHRELQREWRKAAGDGWHEAGWVTTWPTAGLVRRRRETPHRAGDSVSPHIIGTRFNAMAKRLGLPTIRLYDLRHTSATLALALGQHPKLVQERLGHSKIGTTLDVYSHVLPGLHEQAVAELGASIFGETRRGKQAAAPARKPRTRRSA